MFGYATDQRRITIWVLFDFSKAFDRVNHAILIEKLRGSTSLTQCFYELRHILRVGQVIRDRWSDTKFSPVDIAVSVLKGFVLGFVLFSLYLSDFGSILSNCGYNFYDDLIICLDCED